MILVVPLLVTVAFAGKQDKGASDAQFSSRDVERLMTSVADGLIAQNARKMLSAFDPQMPGFADFRERIEIMLREYDSFRVNYKVQDATSENDRGIALVDFQMEAVPRNDMSAPVRKGAQLRLECSRTPKGWKIVSFEPPNFFSLTTDH
jgi:hypothetical protein